MVAKAFSCDFAGKITNRGHKVLERYRITHEMIIIMYKKGL